MSLVVAVAIAGCAATPPRPAPSVVAVAPPPSPSIEPDGRAAPGAASTASAEAPVTPEAPPTPVSPPAPEVAVVTGCPRSAVVLVLDRSGSMSGVPIEAAKDAAKATLGLLGRTDCFSVIVFDSRPERVVPITRVVDPPAIAARIATIQATGGTDIRPALVAARDDVLAAVSAKRRVVILLTDGQSSHDGIVEVVKELDREHVQVSTIGLGGGVDVGLLTKIATAGSGRTYMVQDPAKIPSTITKEVGLVLR